jgi:hypothetical protein
MTPSPPYPGCLASGEQEGKFVRQPDGMKFPDAHAHTHTRALLMPSLTRTRGRPAGAAQGMPPCLRRPWPPAPGQGLGGRARSRFDLIRNAQRHVSTRPSHAPASSRHVECTCSLIPIIPKPSRRGPTRRIRPPALLEQTGGYPPSPTPPTPQRDIESATNQRVCRWFAGG